MASVVVVRPITPCRVLILIVSRLGFPVAKERFGGVTDSR